MHIQNLPGSHDNAKNLQMLFLEMYILLFTKMYILLFSEMYILAIPGGGGLFQTPPNPL